MRWKTLILLIAIGQLSMAFFWSHTPPLMSAPHPLPSRVRWRRHDVGGFHLSLGKRDMILPQGSQLLIPEVLAPPDTLPDFSKV
jgi:hypothetical protein